MADIKTLLGENWKDDITVEELLEATKGMELVDKTQLEPTVRKELFDKTSSELAELKRQLKAAQEANLTEDEQREKALRERDEVITSLRRDLQMRTAGERLAKANIEDATFVNELIEAGAFTDETLDKFLEGLTKLVDSTRTITDREVRKAVLGDTPKGPPPAEGLDIAAQLKNMSLTERMRYAEENPEEYAAYAKKE